MIIRRIGGWPKWDWRSPFDELERMRRDMDRLFEDLTGGLLREPGAGVFPLVNLTEDKENYYVRAELPGIKPEELDISVTGSNLSLSGERKFADEEEGAKYHRREREGGRFSRIISLPGQTNTEKVKAQSQDGILTVILPKAASEKPKQISIKTA
jgi:HSP20 family protein